MASLEEAPFIATGDTGSLTIKGFQFKIETTADY